MNANPGLPSAFRGRLRVQMDRDLPCSLLLDVLATASQVRYGEFRLAGFNGDEGRQAVIDVSLPALGGSYGGFDAYDDRPPLNLTLLVDEDGYRILATGGILDGSGEALTVPRKDGEYDTGALHDLLLRIKDEYPDEENVIVLPDADLSHGDLIATLDAARERGDTGDRWDDRLFPFVILAGAGEPPDTLGLGGLGSRGSGGGLGGLGTKGRVPDGTSGYGSGGGYFGRKSSSSQTGVGDPIILGAIDKALIDAVIRRHLAQIRYCYQRELSKQPDLAGKVVVKFVIDATGAVEKAEIRTSTLDNATVEECLVNRFLRMQFPEPKGGGIVIVSYPFLFKSAADDGE